MQLPHRTITPDTVVIQDNGTPILLPSLIGDPVSDIADDLTALAKLMHYAITREVLAVRPLRGRALEGYSDSLLRAIDCSLAADPAKRPHTVGELRDILGIVVCGRSATARTHTRRPPAQSLEAAQPRARHAIQGLPTLPRPRWTWAGTGLVVLLAVGVAIVGDKRRAPTVDDLAVTLTPRPAAPPAPRDMHKPATQGPVLPEPIPPVASGAMLSAEAGHAHPDDTGATPPGNRAPEHHAKARGRQPPAEATPAAAVPPAPELPAPELPAPEPPAPVAAPLPPLARAATVPAKSGTGYTLRIRPWGLVRVDGVERGISPPIKRLVLAPGRHSILISNPGASDRALEVDTSKGEADIAVDFDSGPP